jgi:pimeloyl-ACP methyl ester carboxylesterase
MIVLTLPPALLCFGIACFFHTKSSDPIQVTKPKTPILLIHGSASNQQQWLVFRRFLETNDTGHTFALNLNKHPIKNDVSNVTDYAKLVHTKLLSMKRMYLEAGYDMNEVILIGNSMGGFVGGAYCVSEALADKISVAGLITISSPWQGSWMADKFCKDIFPEKYFRRDSDDRKALVSRVQNHHQKGGLQLYTYGSQFDLLVNANASMFVDAPYMIDNRNDHWTTMLDCKLAREIRTAWINPHTICLNKLY